MINTFPVERYNMASWTHAYSATATSGGSNILSHEDDYAYNAPKPTIDEERLTKAEERYIAKHEARARKLHASRSDSSSSDHTVERDRRRLANVGAGAPISGEVQLNSHDQTLSEQTSLKANDLPAERTDARGDRRDVRDPYLLWN